MTLAIILIVAGIISIIIGLAIGFSSLRKFAQSDGASNPFSVRLLIAMVFDLLGGGSFTVGIVLLIMALI